MIREYLKTERQLLVAQKEHYGNLRKALMGLSRNDSTLETQASKLLEQCALHTDDMVKCCDISIKQADAVYKWLRKPWIVRVFTRCPNMAEESNANR